MVFTVRYEPNLCMQCQLIAAQAVSRLSRRRDQGSISGKYAWDSWWIERHQDKYFPSTLNLPLYHSTSAKC